MKMVHPKTLLQTKAFTSRVCWPWLALELADGAPQATLTTLIMGLIPAGA